MTDPNEKARQWLRHLMNSVQHLNAKLWVTEQLLFAANPAVSQQQWEHLIELFMKSPAMKENMAKSQQLIEKAMKRFEDTILLHEAEQQLEQTTKQVAELEKQFIELVSKLPPPKFQN